MKNTTLMRRSAKEVRLARRKMRTFVVTCFLTKQILSHARISQAQNRSMHGLHKNAVEEHSRLHRMPRPCLCSAGLLFFFFFQLVLQKTFFIFFFWGGEEDRCLRISKGRFLFQSSITTRLFSNMHFRSEYFAIRYGQ